MKTSHHVNWLPLPDQVREDELNVTLQWTADERTTRAIERQAKLMGMTPNEYLRQAPAAVIAGDLRISL